MASRNLEVHLPATIAHLQVPHDRLRYRCDPSKLPFESTADVDPIVGLIGQDEAMEALRFGLEINAPGHNVYVRGLAGTGRMTLVKRLVLETRTSCPLAQDRCYVHNFAESDRPALVTLERGQGPLLRTRMQEFVRFLANELGEALAGDAITAKREAIEQRARDGVQALLSPFDAKLRKVGLTLVSVKVGSENQPAILPLLNGEPLPPEQYAKARSQGLISDEDDAALRAHSEEAANELDVINKQLLALQSAAHDEVRALHDLEVRSLLTQKLDPVATEFSSDAVKCFLTATVNDVVQRILMGVEFDSLALRRYQVNVLSTHEDGGACAVVIENSPSPRNLLGGIDKAMRSDGSAISDHLMISGGSMLRADGGYLILEAREALNESGAWKALVRTLRSGMLDIHGAESTNPFSSPTLKPEPIPINVKVIIIGDPGLYYLLDAKDPDFPHIFKVLADFDSTIANTEKSIEGYAGVLSRILSEEGLPPFHKSAVAALAEHGARVAARQDRLTTKFGRLADIAREAVFVARRDARDLVEARDVTAAIKRGKARADLPARHFRERIADGTLRIQIDGREVGQVNGLAVIHAGPLAYGFPTRITATIGPGHRGAINIERESNLSGAIHTKGFYILGGLLRHLLRTEHPLAFNASLAFEQSYGGIDGDSASGAEACCLLSALTGAPLRQGVAMTGAIDQHGHIQPIGAVNEKIEGFFDACRDLGLTGEQGVIIPKANARDLMLREDVISACAEDRFHIWAVGTIHEALSVFTGFVTGEWGVDGYPEGTLLHRAVERAHDYWRYATGQKNDA